MLKTVDEHKRHLMQINNQHRNVLQQLRDLEIRELELRREVTCLVRQLIAVEAKGLSEFDTDDFEEFGDMFAGGVNHAI